MGTTGMQFESPTLEFESILNLVFQSTLLVVIVGTIFFLLGFWMAWLTWGKYRRQCLYLRQDMAILEEEVISLKKKLTEQMLAHPALRAVATTPTDHHSKNVVVWPSATDLNRSSTLVDHDDQTAETFPEVSTLAHEGVIKGAWHSPAKLPQSK